MFAGSPLARPELAIDRIVAEHANADFCLLTGAPSVHHQQLFNGETSFWL